MLPERSPGIGVSEDVPPHQEPSVVGQRAVDLRKSDIEVDPVNRCRRDCDIEGLLRKLGVLDAFDDDGRFGMCMSKVCGEPAAGLHRRDVQARGDQGTGRLPRSRSDVQGAEAGLENTETAKTVPQGRRIRRPRLTVDGGVRLEMHRIDHARKSRFLRRPAWSSIRCRRTCRQPSSSANATMMPAGPRT